jgi:hypothetical protein
LQQVGGGIEFSASTPRHIKLVSGVTLRANCHDQPITPTFKCQLDWIFFAKDLWLSFASFAPYLVVAFALAAVLRHMGNPLSYWFAIYPAYLVYRTPHEWV